MLSRLDWFAKKPGHIGVMGQCLREAVSQKFLEAEVKSLTSSEGLQFDLILAHLSVTSPHEVELALKVWRKQLRPEGILLITAYGPDTLRELREHFSGGEIADQIDLHDVGDGLVAAGLQDPVMEVAHYTMTYRDKSQMIHELIANGLLSGNYALFNLDGFNPQEDDAYHLTIELVIGHAFAPSQDQQTKAEDGSVRIPLSALKSPRKS